MKKWATALTMCITALIMLGGCLTDSVVGEVQLVKLDTISEYDASKGPYKRVTFTLKNAGDATAENVTMNLTVSDQQNNTEFDDTLLINSSLEKGGVTAKTVSVYYDDKDTLLNAEIKITWNGGSNNYRHQWVT